MTSKESKTLPKESNEWTAIAIHGMPGNYEHFSGLFETFGGKESSVRVISPNMPEFSLTRQSMAFWHSNNERSQFIRDFLKAINVSQIDCLISHSAGIHPIAKIWSKPEDLKIGSIGLFCPQPLWVTKLFFRLSRNLAYFAENKIGIKLMDVLRPDLIAHRFGYPMRFESVDEVLMLWLFSRLDPNNLHKRLEYLKNHKIPTLVVYGERDKLIQKSANERDFVRFTDENTPQSRPQNDDKILSKICYPREFGLLGN
ncbi:unnamed protein product [Medioppia subpectinata]|uniref:Alpha/beta hydrolase n=1 Tax=Medioppia subpectinata TaxID=1979941 RepID=A0A7R9KHQ7_9ACAR|nr:unnamed protein product [Medioppia subpectinata]CAG2103669.1 unnamed protein product [Medioppia subpectinata]